MLLALTWTRATDHVVTTMAVYISHVHPEEHHLPKYLVLMLLRQHLQAGG